MAIQNKRSSLELVEQLGGSSQESRGRGLETSTGYLQLPFSDLHSTSKSTRDYHHKNGLDFSGG